MKFKRRGIQDRTAAPLQRTYDGYFRFSADDLLGAAFRLPKL